MADDISTKVKKKHNLYLIEDTCEALGSKYNYKYLGTYGDFGTYSFFHVNTNPGLNIAILPSTCP